ncbi:MAG: pyrroloquinoline quinone precursor peptide PqqA [Gemmatimonadetes bacterium]|nr:pyrroloquinoline quinone precursor peptide PqqA [Gemmatimonadota bacterium]
MGMAARTSLARVERHRFSTRSIQLFFNTEAEMAWITPDFVAIPLGCEVTTYAYAE